MNLQDIYNTFVGCAAALAVGALLRLFVDSVWPLIRRERNRERSISAFEARSAKMESLRSRTATPAHRDSSTVAVNGVPERSESLNGPDPL